MRARALLLGALVVPSVAMVASTVPDGPGAGAADPPPPLVAGYGFDEGAGGTATDASGHGLTGTLVNGPTWLAGRYGTALNFNGTSQYVNLANPTALRLTGSTTISAWINSSAFPGDDAAVVSKRGNNNNGYQLDTTTDRGPRTIGFKLTNSSGKDMIRYGATVMQANTWYHIAGVYNAATATIDVYLNGQLDNGPLVGTVTTSQRDTNQNVNIGRRPAGGFGFIGRIDDVRIYDRALTRDQIAADSATSVTGAAPPDSTPPTVSITAPADSAQIADTVTVTATATDNIGVGGVQFLVDANPIGAEDTTAPYGVQWDSRTVGNGAHTLTARARDTAGNTATSTGVNLTVANVAPPPSTIVAGYGFDEGAGGTAADASGHGLTGTLVNGPAWVAGRYGTALDFNGADQYVDLANPTALRLTGSMTISGWINSSAFPGDDAAVVSKRGTDGFQLDTTTDRGPRTIGFKLTNSSGADMIRYGATSLQTNVWYHIAGVYNAATATMDVYLNGQLDNGPLVGTVTSSQRDSSQNVNIGRRPAGGFGFIGRIDDVRIYDRALTINEVQADLATSVTGASPPDPTPPTVSITAPANGAQVADIITVTATAADNIGVGGVQFLVDGNPTGVEDTTAPYGLQWDTRSVNNGAHVLTARARDTAGNTTTSSGVNVNVANTNFFQNEVLATGFELPTTLEFLPDGRLLVAELAGRVRVLSPPYTQASSTPFLQLTNIGSAGVQQGIYDIELDPDFTTNHFFYAFYTLGSPNRDRLSRFTANAGLTGTVAGSEVVLYQDPQDANAEHHGGAIVFGNDGKLYFTTGEHFNAGDAQLLTNPRGKIHRINKDGTIPTDNPFYDGTGPRVDSIWAYGLRNPFRAFYDAPTGRLYVGDVGGNDNSTAKEEVNVGAAGANYGWPNSEGPCSGQCTSPLYWYPHNGRDAAITGGFVYHGTQFPAGYQGNYFFADYTQNWIKRLILDAAGNVTGVANFEPADGSNDGPYGDIVDLTEGPDGTLYYLDLGYSDVGGTFGVSKLRQIRFITSNQPPVAVAGANPTSGLAPLTVNFSSAGSIDPEGAPLRYAWDFGDGTSSTAANPTHQYTQPGRYTARLTVSDGVNSTISTPITISVGNVPTPTILSPADGALFVAGDVIAFSGNATDTEDGTLPASAFTWQVDFLHEGHVHPGVPITGVKSGSFTIPTSGHDFSGDTRYRIRLTVVDSSGLSSSTEVIVRPRKVNLSFATTPPGLTLYLDGIAKTTPFVYDTLVGFHHTVEARNQSVGGTTYTFASWSDGGAQQHELVVPAADQSYTATFTASTVVSPPAFVQVAAATPQTDQSTVTVTYPQAQTGGNADIVAVGWNDGTSTISAVTDSAGNTYQIAAPIRRGAGLSQAIYYAKNIRPAAAGTNTVTVRFNAPVPFADIRITEYRGLDPTNPLDATASTSGTTATATTGNVTTASPVELVFGAGMTSGTFTGSATDFTTRLITTPDADIVNDRVVTATGSYAAGAVLAGSSAWVMQVATFRTP